MEFSRDVLRECIVYLREHLNTAEVECHLLADNLITCDQVERLENEVVTAERAQALIRMILKNPRGFDVLVKALRQVRTQEFIADYLEEQYKTKVYADQDKRICKWLHSRLVQSETTVRVSELLNFINERCDVDLGDRVLTLGDALQYVKSFSSIQDCEIEDDDQIERMELHITMTEDKCPEVTPLEETYTKKPMEKWTTDDVCKWLESIDQASCVNEFRSEEINGYALSKLDRALLKDMGLKIGSIVNILGRRDDLLKVASANSCEVKIDVPRSPPSPVTPPTVQVPSEIQNPGDALTGSEVVPSDDADVDAQCEQDECSETMFDSTSEEPAPSLPPSSELRKFDTPADVTFKYKKAAQLSCIDPRPGGDLLLPVHRFVLVDLSTKTGLVEFVQESVKFVCACLNERTNGTIHFGIGNKGGSSLSFCVEITGTALSSRTDYTSHLAKAFKKCFSEDQINCVHPGVSCVRQPIFIEVLPKDTTSRFVVEIDVVAQHKYCEDLAFYARVPFLENQSVIYEDMKLYRIMEGTPRVLCAAELASFMRLKGSLAESRRSQEALAISRLTSVHCTETEANRELETKFRHLLCDGEENLRGEHNLILVTNSPKNYMTSEWMKENLKFLLNLRWRAVFDFDEEKVLCNFFRSQNEVLKVTMSEEFNARSQINIQEKGLLEKLHDDMRKSVDPRWIFVNGCSSNQNDGKLPPAQWKMNKSAGFKEAVHFLRDEIPPNRATVVFMLFSEDTDVILEASEEFIASCFPNHWFCVAESHDVAKKWVDELIRRHCIESPDVDRVIMGMPWNLANKVVSEVRSPKYRIPCELLTSSGAIVELEASDQNEMSDLEILGYNECANSPELANADLKERRENEEEIEFYQGRSASWWNFYFPNQVCKREIHKELKNGVTKLLDSKSYENLVERICIYHQPGAGGSTCAKQVLWELRKSYRVAIVRNITDQTANQIQMLHRYKDKTPKSILLLLDNPEEEKANLLLSELEQTEKKLRRHGDDQNQMVCVFLVCLRRSQVSKRPGSKQVSRFASNQDAKRWTLEHELSEREIKWFQAKSRTLQRQYETPNGLSVDPRSLLSFNILKENFNKDFIMRIVKEFVADISHPKERKLLKYVSFINAFDLQFRPLPTSAFDGLMVEEVWVSGPRRGKGAHFNRWENKLSDAFRTLVNDSSATTFGSIHSLRVANPLLSKHILFTLAGSGAGSEPLSAIAIEFFRIPEIFGVKSRSSFELLNIVTDILKERGRLPNGQPETTFAPLIQEIDDKETHENAATVLQEGMKLINDVFIAQQLARLLLKAQEWDRAVEVISSAIDQKPDNSYLWDTYGRIHHDQLVEEYNKLVRRKTKLSVRESVDLIQIGIKGMEIFRKVQHISEQEKSSSTNNAGFFGEIQMTVMLLDCLNYVEVFEDIDSLRRFILDDSYIPGNMQSILTDVDGRDYLKELKGLKQHVERAMNRLEDELIQLRANTSVDAKRNDYRGTAETLSKIKTNLNVYFGEYNDQPCQEHSDDFEQCEHRRRRIFFIAGNNLGSIFDLRWTHEGEKKLCQVRELAHKNVTSRSATADDYRTLISTNLALNSMSPSYLYRINLDEMVEWSKKLYELRNTKRVIYLEPYLFYVMFNWPRRNTRHCLARNVLQDALQQWKEAYKKKYPRQCLDPKRRKKDVTLFFLANGSEMASIYTTCEGRFEKSNESFWRHPETMRQLQRFEGVLTVGGTNVDVQLQNDQGQKSSLTIPTSFPVSNSNKWNQTVFFVIGFSWIGPKAFDITLKDPTLEADMSERHQVMKPTQLQSERDTWSRKPPYLVEITQEEFSHKLMEIDQKLERIQKLKEKKKYTVLSNEELALLRRENSLHRDRNELLERRLMKMVSRIPEYYK